MTHFSCQGDPEVPRLWSKSPFGHRWFAAEHRSTDGWWLEVTPMGQDESRWILDPLEKIVGSIPGGDTLLLAVRRPELLVCHWRLADAGKPPLSLPRELFQERNRYHELLEALSGSNPDPESVLLSSSPVWSD